MAKTEPMVAVQALVKAFGPRRVLAGVDLMLAPGESLVLVGPNGAGKTTLLRILATLSRPTSGTVRVAGQDLAHAGEEVRHALGFLSHRLLLYEDLTALQNLLFYARMYDLPDARARAVALLERVGLADRAHDLVGTFSRGMQQRLAVARAVLHRPRLLLLDEPYTGLDLRATDLLTRLLAEVQEEGCSLLVTTHDLVLGLQLAGRVGVLSGGHLVYDAPRTQLDPATFPALYQRLTA